MATITIQHEFSLSRDEVKLKLVELAEAMTARYQLNCDWPSEDCLRFKRSGASGEINIQAHSIRFNLKLGLMLTAFKTTIDKDVRQFLQDNID
ncbi:polyhydroxyalkanoic acid system family protein [Oceanicoccus sp. KOV_DT_Chl]|uniref:polyhydroxyalkanoic acid system family protein n=1 Tax=Oceanicoccus sp. KOV_DT_Chl TaxID=1904639 RepID=UPI000C7D7E67|nr:polyhydroxyalkanoic acid system family protein [Oceanicoccus sp. KOV_DT_Chl]